MNIPRKLIALLLSALMLLPTRAQAVSTTPEYLTAEAALLDSTSTLRHPAKTDVDIHADYLSEKMVIDIEIGFSICVWQLFDILFRTGFRLTKHL